MIDLPLVLDMDCQLCVWGLDLGQLGIIGYDVVVAVLECVE